MDFSDYFYSGNEHRFALVVAAEAKYHHSTAWLRTTPTPRREAVVTNSAPALNIAEFSCLLLHPLAILLFQLPSSQLQLWQHVPLLVTICRCFTIFFSFILKNITIVTNTFLRDIKIATKNSKYLLHYALLLLFL